jgi:hypothetical protein
VLGEEKCSVPDSNGEIIDIRTRAQGKQRELTGSVIDMDPGIRTGDNLG